MVSAGRRLARVAWLWALAAPAGVGAQTPIAIENARAGDPGWALTHTAPAGVLEAYAGEASVQHGEPVDVHVRADGAHTVTWKLYRMGWYGGAGGRLVAQGGPVAVGPQSVPAPDASTGRVECRWPTTFTIATDAGWTSGVHLVKLQRDDGPQTYAIFVVRADERKGAAVVQASFTTSQAYNAYGGKSLYVGPAQEVSFDRPYAEGSGSGQFFRYEHDFIRWAEARGYDLTYLTGLDVDRDPALLRGQRIFLSVGHDEYWTRAARDALEAALGAGVDAAFLGGNAMYWQIRLEPSRADPSRLRRTQVCYKKQSQRDPAHGTPLETTSFRDPALGDPEDATLGVMYADWELADAPWVVAGADAWIYEGTGVRDGDTIPGIVGYETDRTFDDGRAPAQLTRVARSPVVNIDGTPGWHEAAVSTRASGAFVFAAGSIEFVWGLAHPGYADARVQRMVENVLRRAGLEPAAGGEPSVAGAPAPDTTGAAQGVVTIAGQAFAEGLVNGPGAQARFRRPAGVAVDAAGEVFVADTGNHAIRLVHPDAAHTVETIAGDGTPGDGDGPTARLRSPQAVAVAPDGSVVVGDTGNARLVRLVHAGSGWTATTLAGRAGFQGSDDGAAADARFTGPTGLAYVGDDLYVADRQNQLVRKVAPDGTVSTLAGASDGTWWRDGALGDARFHYPSALAADGGDLYVLDAGNRVVRRIALSAGGAVTTVAGVTGGGFADGQVGAARFMPIAGIAAQGGALLVADAGNARVRRVSDGMVTTWAGSGRVGGEDGTGATAALAGPTGIAPLGGGVWIVADGASSTLRLAGAVPPPQTGRGDGGGGAGASGGTASGGGGGGCSTGGEWPGAVVLAALAGWTARRRRRRASA